MSEITPPVPRVEQEYSPVEVFVAQPEQRHRYWLHILLLLLTFATTMLVGTRLELNFLQNKPVLSFVDDWIPLFPLKLVLHNPRMILLGLPFSLTLMGILLCHEMGHYIYCLRYGVWATLPYFIPAPTLIGTMGAFIRIKSAIRSRAALFDIGIAGPIAGFVVALLVLLFALPMSKAAPLPTFPDDHVVIGFPLIFHLVYWFMLGDGTRLMPLNRMLLHPMAIAAWVGMFATALNFLPGGQLDGGHIVYSLFPRGHKYVSYLTIGILLPMAYLWPGWLFWAVLLWVSGMRHPVVPAWPQVTPGRRLLAVAALAMLVLTFVPVPLVITQR